MLFPGQGLTGRLPLLSPVFRHSNLRRQVHPRLHDSRDPSSERWKYGREYCPVNSAEMTNSTHFGIFHMPQITTWDRRLYFPSGGRRAEDFFPLKIRRLPPGLKPRTRVPEPSTLNPRPPKLLISVGYWQQNV